MIGIGILGKDFPIPLARNGHGNEKKRCSRMEIAMEAHIYNSYLVRIDGSGRVSQETNLHLKPITVRNSMCSTRTNCPPPSHQESIEYASVF